MTPVFASFTGVFVTPLIASPVVVTLMTFPAVTCCLNTSYGSVTVVGWAGASKTLVMMMLASRMMPRVIHSRVDRSGLVGAGGDAGFVGFSGFDDIGF